MAFNEQDCIPDPSHFEPCEPGTCGPCDQNFNQKYFSHGSARAGVPNERVLTPLARINGWPVELQPGQFIPNQFLEAPELSYDAQNGVLNVGGRFVQIGDTQMNQKNCKGEAIGPCDAVVSCANLREQGLNSTGVVLKDPNNPLAGYTIKIAPGSLLTLTANGLDINLSALCAYVKANCVPAPGPNPDPGPAPEPDPGPPPPNPDPVGNLTVSPSSTVVSGTAGTSISQEQLYWSSSGCGGGSPSVTTSSGNTPAGLSVNISGTTSGYITISGTPSAATSGYVQYQVTLGTCVAYFTVYYNIATACAANGTHIRWECNGTTRVEIVANGSCGERTGQTIANSPDCGYVPPGPDPDPTPDTSPKSISITGCVGGFASCSVSWSANSMSYTFVAGGSSEGTCTFVNGSGGAVVNGPSTSGCNGLSPVSGSVGCTAAQYASITAMTVTDCASCV